jgi:hypothetical protein
MPSHQLSIISACLCSLTLSPLIGADDVFSDNIHNEGIPRVGVQLLVGTSGFEPGIFAEWKFREQPVVVRPEVFLNEDERVGAGISLGWEFTFLNLPDTQHLTVGPRFLYHNSDESGWEGDVLGIWGIDFFPSHHGRHLIEVIGAVCVLEEEKDGDDDIVIGASIGIGYGYQF